MDTKQFNKVVKDTLVHCESVLCKKATEYATEDRLHNFKSAAIVEQTTPIGALAGMMAKHTISVYDMCKGSTKGVQYSSALWDEKITDSINYLLLLKALIAEDEQNEGSQKTS